MAAPSLMSFCKLKGLADQRWEPRGASPSSPRGGRVGPAGPGLRGGGTIRTCSCLTALVSTRSTLRAGDCLSVLRDFVSFPFSGHSRLCREECSGTRPRCFADKSGRPCGLPVKTGFPGTHLPFLPQKSGQHCFQGTELPPEATAGEHSSFRFQLFFYRREGGRKSGSGGREGRGGDKLKQTLR